MGQNQSQGTKEMRCLSSTQNCFSTSLMAQRNQTKHLLLLQHSFTSCSLFSPSVLSFCNTSFLSSFQLQVHLKTNSPNLFFFSLVANELWIHIHCSVLFPRHMLLPGTQRDYQQLQHTTDGKSPRKTVPNMLHCEIFEAQQRL